MGSLYLRYFGLCVVGSVTFDSAAYVARYVVKKVTGDAAEQHYMRMAPDGSLYQLQPEFVNMSRRPGIGTDWYNKYKSDVYPNDVRIVRGVKQRPPKFYDNLYKKEFPSDFEYLQFLRQNKFDIEDNTLLRLSVKEEVVNRRLALYPRE